MKKEVYIFRPKYTLDNIHLPYLMSDKFESKDQYIKELEKKKFNCQTLPYGTHNSIVDNCAKVSLSDNNIKFIDGLFNDLISTSNEIFDFKRNLIKLISKMSYKFLTHINQMEFCLKNPISPFKNGLFTITHIKNNNKKKTGGYDIVYKINGSYEYPPIYSDLDDLMNFYSLLSKEMFDSVVSLDYPIKKSYTVTQVQSRLNKFFIDNNIPIKISFYSEGEWVEFILENKYSEYFNLSIYYLTNKTKNMINEFMSENYGVLNLIWKNASFSTNQLLTVESGE